MNEEHKQLFDAINGVSDRLIVIETTQKLRHEENRKDMDALGGLTRSVEKHCHEIGKLKVHRGTQWYFIAGIIISIIGVAIRSW